MIRAGATVGERWVRVSILAAFGAFGWLKVDSSFILSYLHAMDAASKIITAGLRKHYLKRLPSPRTLPCGHTEPRFGSMRLPNRCLWPIVAAPRREKS
jgi:hypothetical protein